MNAHNRRSVPTLSRARGITGVLFASALVVASIAAPAEADEALALEVPIARVLDARIKNQLTGPTEAALAACLARIGDAEALQGQGVTLVGAGSYELAEGRQIITLDTEVGMQGRGMRPRFYCTIEPDNGVSLVQSMPRLDLRPARQRVVAN